MAKSSESTNYLGQLEDMLDEYLVKKAPAMPENVKESLVKFMPWIEGIGALVMISALSFLNFIFGFISPFVGYRSNSIVFEIVQLIAVILTVMSIPGLLKKTEQGWKLSFYAVLAYFIAQIFSNNPLGGLITAIISLYILFQIRSYYK